MIGCTISSDGPTEEAGTTTNCSWLAEDNVQCRCCGSPGRWVVSAGPPVIRRARALAAVIRTCAPNHSTDCFLASDSCELSVSTASQGIDCYLVLVEALCSVAFIDEMVIAVTCRLGADVACFGA